MQNKAPTSKKQIKTILSNEDFQLFTGVPCSTFGGLLEVLYDTRHIPAVNEGDAIAIAAGFNIKTGKIPVVYMQNSGLCNAMDALTSLVNEEVYNIPMLLWISHRGYPDTNDAVQHEKMGQITPELLQLLGIPYIYFDPQDGSNIIARAHKLARKYSQRVAVLFKKGDLPSAEPIRHPNGLMNRRDAIETIVSELNDEIFICNTGYISREVHRVRKKQKDLYILGSMGAPMGIALGIAKAAGKPVNVIDGDGSVMMHMGNLVSIATEKAKIRHMVINNHSYESTGGQPNALDARQLDTVARSCGYKSAGTVYNKEALVRYLHAKKRLPNMCEVVTATDTTLEKPPRPEETPTEILNNFKANLNEH